MTLLIPSPPGPSRSRLILICSLAAACPATAVPALPPSLAPALPLPAAQSSPAGCFPTRAAYLRARLRGASNLDIDWRGQGLQCDGGVRPDGHGMRVTFAGSRGTHGHHLRFVFGIDAPPDTRNARAVPANVTVIFEGERRLYSTRDERCTIDALRSTAVGLPTAAGAPGAGRAGGRSRLLRVSARGFCIPEAKAFDGGPGLLVSRFDFVGTVALEDHDPTPP